MTKVCPECKDTLKVVEVTLDSLTAIYTCSNKDCIYFGLLTINYEVVETGDN